VSAVQSISVILCCAHADAVHVRPLAEYLRSKGTKVRLLEGIDEDAHLLGASLDLELGACMFVACLSDTLGPKDFRRLTGIYSARKGPQHYLADIMVEPDELPAMIENINVALGRAGKVIASGDRDKRANSRGPTRLRDVVGVTGISAVGESPAAPARGRKPKGGADERADQRAPLREQSVAGPYVISSRNGAGPGIGKTEQPAKTESGSPARPAPAVVEPKPIPAATSSSWMSAVLFLILIAVAGTVALVTWQDRNDPASDRGVPKPAVISPSSEPATSDAKPEPAQPEPAQPEPAQPEAPLAVSEPVPEPSEAVDEAAVIRESIAAGELRAIDLILIASPDAQASWREAANLCRGKSLRGVRDWRLPSVEELKTIRNARMLDKDRYWSGTLAPQVGDGSNHVFVLDLEARTLDPVSKEATDVRVLCVRAALP
jgi:hypothetical protein